MIAPRPPAASRPPAAFFSYPTFSSIGYATAPNVTVVATPMVAGFWENEIVLVLLPVHVIVYVVEAPPPCV